MIPDTRPQAPDRKPCIDQRRFGEELLPIDLVADLADVADEDDKAFVALGNFHHSLP